MVHTPVKLSKCSRRVQGCTFEPALNDGQMQMQRERQKTEDLQLKMHLISKTEKILLQIFTLPSFYGSFEALRQGISVAEKTPVIAIKTQK